MPESSKEIGSSKEIERKFLVEPIPDQYILRAIYEHVKIAQGYLVVSESGAVRLRQKGDKYFITYKSSAGNHEAERTELETALTKEQFDTLWPGTEGRRLEKTRYVVPQGIPYPQYIVELDVFEGLNDGHALAEVEFTSTAEADNFTPPGWLGREVTADKRYGNASISERGFPAD